MKKFAITLNSFAIEFQPFIEEINAKEGVIRQCADAATMDRVKGLVPHNTHNWANSNAAVHTSDIEGILEGIVSELKPLAILNGWLIPCLTIRDIRGSYETELDISTTATHTLTITEQIRDETNGIFKPLMI